MLLADLLLRALVRVSWGCSWVQAHFQEQGMQKHPPPPPTPPPPPPPRDTYSQYCPVKGVDEGEAAGYRRISSSRGASPPHPPPPSPPGHLLTIPGKPSGRWQHRSQAQQSVTCNTVIWGRRSNTRLITWVLVHFRFALFMRKSVLTLAHIAF